METYELDGEVLRPLHIKVFEPSKITHPALLYRWAVCVSDAEVLSLITLVDIIPDNKTLDI